MQNCLFQAFSLLSRRFDNPWKTPDFHHSKYLGLGGFLVANATKNFALATRISQLVASGRLTISCHDNYTITLIFSQIN